MGKQKIWVESITTYIGKVHDKDKDRLYEVEVKINGDMNEVEVDISSKKNLGGEAWDWAQNHWDEFIPIDGPTVEVRGVTVATVLRWACVQGIFKNKDKTKHLSIDEVGYKTGKNTSYAKNKKAARGKETPKFKTKEDKTKKSSPSRREGGLKDGIRISPEEELAGKSKVKERKELSGKVPVVPSKSVDSMDMDAIRAAKISKVLEEDEKENT